MMSQMTKIWTVRGTLEAQTGLRIGAGKQEMHIGGTDNEVIRHPITKEPYIPGSSIKGKMRSLLEWYFGLAGVAGGAPFSVKHLEKLSDETQIKNAKMLLKLFGISGDAASQIDELAPTRAMFRDASLDQAWVTERRENGEPLVEVKSENSIDRIQGVAGNPRQTERVPAGASFDFEINVKQLYDGDEALVDLVLKGLKLLEYDALGASGSRGYGKVKVRNLTIDGENKQDEFDRLNPFKE